MITAASLLDLHSDGSSQRPRSRKQAAGRVLEICAEADGLADAAEASLEAGDERLFQLIEQRDAVLQELAECIVILQQGQPAADSSLVAISERIADDGDKLIQQVRSALDTSRERTNALVSRVAARVSELREELNRVHKAGSAQLAYAPHSGAVRVDSFR